MSKRKISVTGGEDLRLSIRLTLLALLWFATIVVMYVRSPSVGWQAQDLSKKTASHRIELSSPEQVAEAKANTAKVLAKPKKEINKALEEAWLPPLSGSEAYRQRFESPERKVVPRTRRPTSTTAPVVRLKPRIPHAPVAAANIRNMLPGNKRVALTFDVEKDEGAIVQILSVLRKEKLKATFFVTGLWADTYPQRLKEIAADGHEIANHSYYHPMFTRIPDDAAIAEIVTTEARIFAITKSQPARYFRPPYGDYDQRILNIAASQGFRVILWSNDSVDWQPWQNPTNVWALATQSLKDGDIVLFHSFSPATGGAIQGIIDEVKKRGFKQVTISELIGG